VSDDPTDLSMGALEKRILHCCDLLERATHAVKERGVAFSEADAEFDRVFYRTLLETRMRAKEPEYVCKAAAMDEASALNQQRKILETAYESAREAGRNLRAEAELLRTLCANLRPLVSER
jgi:hypothetical protein